jgi:hypothetical protein
MAKNITITTPKGIAVYPWLNKADDKFGDPVYKTDLKIELGLTEDLTSKVDDVFADFFADKKESESGNYADIYAEDMPFYEEDGLLILRAKLNKQGKNRKTQETWENKMAFFDSQGVPIPADRLPKIGGGSILRLGVEVNPYAMAEVVGKGKNKITNLKCGISLRIKAVMVIEARNEAVAPSSSEFGFEAEEGGYAFDPEAVDGGGDDPEDF